MEQSTDSAHLMAQILLGKRNATMKYTDLKNEFTKYRSKSTFFKTLKSLIEHGIVYEVEKEEEEYLEIIPKEIIKYVKSSVKTIEMKAEELEEEIKELKHFDDLLRDYTTKEDLSGLLEDADLPKTGKKQTLINRLMYESVYGLDEILDSLFSKNILREICSELGVKKSGNKSEIIDRIIDKLLTKKVRKIETVITPEEAPALGETAAAGKKKVPTVRETLEDICDLMKHIKVPQLATGKVERQIESIAFSLLDSHNYAVDLGGKVRCLGKEYTTDGIMKYEGQEIAIEIKHVGRASDLERAEAQINCYRKHYPYVLLVLYDTRKKFNRITIEEISKYKERDIFVVSLRH